MTQDPPTTSDHIPLIMTIITRYIVRQRKTICIDERIDWRVNKKEIELRIDEMN